MTPPSVQKFDQEEHRKIGCHFSRIRDDQRVSH